MDKVSYFVVDNLHCPSCIFTVKSTLNDELAIPATNVHISLLSQTVTVRHNESITPLVIAHALEKVGFDVEVEDRHNQSHGSSWIPKTLAGRKRKQKHLEVCKSCQAEECAKKEKRSIIPRPSFSKSMRSGKSAAYAEKPPPSPVSAAGSVSADVRTELSVSGMTCASCANAIAEGLKAYRAGGILSCDVNVMANAATVVHDTSRFTADDVAALIEQLGYGAEVVSSTPMGRKRVTSQDFNTDYRLEFHIGGMTCASCSNSITHGLGEEPYIKSVNINLMANSGTVILSKKEDAEKVKEAVETMGFTCDLGEIAPLKPTEASPVNDIRLVRIRIDDMFCKYPVSLR